MAWPNRNRRPYSTRRDHRNRPANRFPVKPSTSTVKTRIVGTRMTEDLRRLAYVISKRYGVTIPEMIRRLIKLRALELLGSTAEDDTPT